MSAATKVTPDLRFRRGDPCPVCGGHSSLPQGHGIRCAGFYSADRQWAHCTREEHAGGIAPDDATPPTFGHWLGGPCKCSKTHAEGAPTDEQKSKKPPKERHNVVRSEFYAVDASGTELGVHVREDYTDQDGNHGKSLRWERHAGRSSIDMPLWNTPAALLAPSDVRLWLCEGEKKARRLQDELRAAGRPDVVVATMTGASATPFDDALRILLARRLTFWHDNDADGKQHMRKIAQRLLALGADRAQLYWVDWSDAPAKADAWDYFAQGGDVKRLELLVRPFTAQESEDEGEASSEAEDITPDPRRDIEQPDAFPTSALPKAMRRLVEEGAQAIQCPPDFIALPALVLAGAAIGNSACIEIKAGWCEPAILWGAVVASPGDKKSPAYDLAREPLKLKQGTLHASFQQELERFREAQASAETAGGVTEPVMQQVYTTDATMEALSDVLERNPRGVAFARDELAGWARSMDQYRSGKGPDRENWLSMWSASPVLVNRRTRKHAQYIPRPFVGVSGTIQPDMLTELSDERGREDGFIHRILFTYPPQVSERWSEDTVSEGARSAYASMFDALWEMQPDTDDDGSSKPHVLRFTPEGKRAWVEWFNDHHEERDAPDFPVNLRGPWRKLEGYAARLALILHCSRKACGETTSHDVDQASMLAAAVLIDYFKAHAKAVYAQLRATPEDKQALAAVAWIRKQPGGKTTVRAIQNAGVTGVKSAAEALELLHQLEKRGYGVVREETSKHGKPSVTFTLHHLTSDNKAPGQAGRAA